MSIKLRLALLLGLLLLGFLGTLLLVRSLEGEELAQMLGDERRARSQWLSHWVDATTRELPEFVSDVAQSDEFASLLALADTDGVRKKIESNLSEANVAALWIVRPNGTVRLAFNG